MDSIIPIGQKNTLAKYMILSGADNRPPMLDKDLYDSWKSIMELYMQNRDNKRMILESVEHEKIQADCDLKATNIILQGLPYDIYSLVNHHIVAKDLWEKLINDMNIYKMKMEQFQVNTKFLNSLPPEWSKFVTDVNLVKDLHTTNFDQLHAYLEQHELHAKEVRLMHKRSQDPLSLVANHQITPSHFNTYQSSYNIQQSPVSTTTTVFTISVSSIWIKSFHTTLLNYLSIHTTCNHLPISTVSKCLLINCSSRGLSTTTIFPVFKQGDDPIDAINKMMSFLSTVVTSRFPSTNNQLRNSSNLRQQATIHDGRTVSKAKEEKECYVVQGKVVLVEAQGNGKVLNEEELEFLEEPSIAEGPVTQSVITHNATYQADDLDAYDSDRDEISTAKAVLMANLSSYGSDVISEVPIFDNTNNDMLNQSVQEMSYSEPYHFVEHPKNEIHNDSSIISYSQYLIESQNAAIQDTNYSAQQDALVLSVFEQLSNQEKEAKNIDTEISLEKKVKELDNIVCKLG
ncbi:hypothetical protein Tco_0579248 [Tanacetum coccineum]